MSRLELDVEQEIINVCCLTKFFSGSIFAHFVGGQWQGRYACCFLKSIVYKFSNCNCRQMAASTQSQSDNPAGTRKDFSPLFYHTGYVFSSHERHDEVNLKGKISLGPA
jgi:hypothetical protein